MTGRRVPVQGDGPYWAQYYPHSTHVPGTITWEEHLEAYKNYVAKYGNSQSAERLVERGGFSYFELVDLLGHEPATFACASGTR